MLPTLIRRMAEAPEPFSIHTNPYKAQRLWPPDLSKLSDKHQFRLERRYRRRAKLKWARPRWTKFTKLAQWGGVLFVIGYAALYIETGKEDSPFSGARSWYKRMADSVWTRSTDQAIPESPTEIRQRSQRGG